MLFRCRRAPMVLPSPTQLAPLRDKLATLDRCVSPMCRQEGTKNSPISHRVARCLATDSWQRCGASGACRDGRCRWGWWQACRLWRLRCTACVFGGTARGKAGGWSCGRRLRAALRTSFCWDLPARSCRAGNYRRRRRALLFFLLHCGQALPGGRLSLLLRRHCPRRLYRRLVSVTARRVACGLFGRHVQS